VVVAEDDNLFTKVSARCGYPPVQLLRRDLQVLARDVLLPAHERLLIDQRYRLQGVARARVGLVVVVTQGLFVPDLGCSQYGHRGPPLLALLSVTMTLTPRTRCHARAQAVNPPNGGVAPDSGRGTIARAPRTT